MSWLLSEMFGDGGGFHRLGMKKDENECRMLIPFFASFAGARVIRAVEVTVSVCRMTYSSPIPRKTSPRPTRRAPCWKRRVFAAGSRRATSCRAGADWGQSIIDAINGCRLMVLVFSSHANESQQVKREVERIVHRGRPIIPMRIEEVLPAQALEYFLSTPHWLDAFTPPLERHLEHLAATVKQMLTQPAGKSTRPSARSRTSWKWYIKPLGTMAAVLIALILLAVIALRDHRGNVPVAGGSSDPDSTAAAGAVSPSPAPKPNNSNAPPAAAPHSPIAGRWQTEMAGGDGKKFNCQMDLQDREMGYLPVAFSDTCPFPFCGASGMAYFAQDGTWAPTVLSRPAKTPEPLHFQAGGLENFSGAYRLEGENMLVMSYAQRGEIRWQRIKAEGPLPNGAEAVLPEQVEWPVKDVPGLVKRALDYVRGHWHEDAQLSNLELKCQPVLGDLADPEVTFKCTFYSPATRKGLWFEPRAKFGNRMREYAASDGGAKPLPAKFLSLPEAIASLRQRASA